MKLAVAESCTGGMISDRITNVRGSSDYFLGGIVAYAYEVKASLLNVSWETLKLHGAVSRETVLEMARGARKALNADVAASVSGIAGPDGGTIDKPIGTVWIAITAPEGEWTRSFQFSGDRLEIKSSSTEAALQFLLDYLQDAINK